MSTNKKMKKLFFCVIIFLFFESPVNASLLMDFGIRGGLSTPNNNINDVYNTGSIKENSNLYNLFRESTKLGYHLGINGRIEMNEEFDFVVGILYHSFPRTGIDVIKNSTDSLIQDLSTSQKILSITGGIDYYFVKSIIDIYTVGELNYNYISSNIEFLKVLYNLDLPSSKSDSRAGISLGAGFDVDLIAVLLNLELKYNITNIIGRVENEKLKSFVAVSFGVFF